MKEDEIFARIELKDTSLADEVKKQAAVLLNLINKINIIPSNEASRCVAIATTNLETSVMWAIKAISRQQEK